MAAKPLEDLRKMLSTDSPLSEIVDRITSTLNSLPSRQDLSDSVLQNFNELMSKSIVVLYDNHPTPTLKLSACIVVELFKSHVSPLLKSEDSDEVNELLKRSEALLTSIFNGLQTYMDGEHPDLVSIGNTLYKPLFGILSSGLGTKLGPRVRQQAFTLLSEAAEENGENRELLKNKTILGAPRLGGIIVATNDYLVLDALFDILARLTPSANDLKGRTSLAKDIFQNSKAKKAFGKQQCNDLSNLLQVAKGKEWQTTTEQLIAVMAKADSLKPQPFRLAMNEVHANSIVHLHPLLLDHIYIDSLGFVVNIQDEDNIDFLEVEYSSITSIRFSEVTCQAIPTVRVTVFLSKPPSKGLGPVIPPSKFESRVHDFVFEITPSDLEAFIVTLEARGLGEMIHRGDRKHYSTKRSITASGPLDLNNLHLTSLEEKSKEVEKFYASSSPNLPSREKDTSAEGYRPGSKPIDDQILFTRDVQVRWEQDEAAAHSKARLPQAIDEDTRMDLVSASEVAVGGTVKARTNLKNINAAFDHDGGHLSADLAPSPSVNPKRHFGKTQPSFMEQLEQEEPRERTGITKLLNRTSHWELSGIDKTELNKIVKKGINDEALTEEVPCIKKISKPQNLKRKHVEDEQNVPEVEDVARNGYSYNSQLLQPRETAITRSTTKYRARAQKPPCSPSHFSDTDFDAVPSSKSRSKFAPSVPSNRPRRKLGVTATGNRHDGTTAATEKKRAATNKSHGKKITPQAPAQDSASVREAQRAAKRPKVSEPNEIQKPAEPKDATTPQKVERKKPAIKEAPPALWSSGNKKTFKKAPWNDPEQFATEDDVPSMILQPAATPDQEDRDVLAYTHSVHNNPPFYENGSPIMDMDEQPPDEVSSEVKTAVKLSMSPIPQDKLEPLDLDLAIAQAGDIHMDIAFDFDPVDSAGDALRPAPSAGVPVNVDSDHDGSETDLALSRGRDSNPFQLPSVPDTRQTVAPRSRDAVEVWNHTGGRGTNGTVTFVQPSPNISSPPPQAHVVRDVVMIDLTGVDDGSGQDEGEDIDEDVMEVSIRGKRQSYSPRQSKRQTVTFADDTKASPHFDFARPIARSGTITARFKPPSLIPRPIPKRSAEDTASLTAKEKKRRTVQSRPTFQLEIPRRIPAAPTEHESEDEEAEITVDDKIVMVLGAIQEAILFNIGRKFDVTKAHAQAARIGLFAHAAEDFQDRLQKSRHNRKNMTQLEADYAKEERKMMQGWEDSNSTNEDTDRTLRQALTDHDTNTLTKMSRPAVSRPKIFQSLANKQ